jgi:hypothetical protein
MARVNDAPGPRSRWLPLRLTAGLAALTCAGVASIPAGTARADTVTNDPNTIACPAAPAGWAIPAATGQAVLSPNSPGVDGERYGGNAAVILCDYFATDGSGKHILASVVYALPTDPNPVGDFYFGCSSSGTAWTASDRVFRVMSPSRWAIAAFTDFLGALDATTVPAFENVTRQLLAATAGYAHTCDLAVRPTPVTSTFSYSFGSNLGDGTGSFSTSGSAPTGGWAAVTSTSAAILPLTLGKGIFTVAVQHGWRFYPGRPSQEPRLSLAVKVTDSDLRFCGTGSTGTLILTQTTLQLRICNQRVSARRASARFSYSGSQ